MPDGTHGVYPKPRAMAVHEIAEVVEHYRQAALNAIEAGLFILNINNLELRL